MKFRKPLFYIAVAIVDYIMLDMYWSYNLDVSNMTYIVIGFVIVGSIAVYGLTYFLKFNTTGFLMVHNVVFAACLFLFSIHAFIDPWDTLAKIIFPILFLGQVFMIFIWYKDSYEKNK